MAASVVRWAAVRLLLKRSSMAASGEPPDVVISSWLERGSLDAAGAPIDRYFPALAEYYRRRGMRVSSVFTLTDPPAGFCSAVRALRPRAGDTLLEQWLRARDLAFPLIVWLRQRRFRFEDARLCGQDVSGLFSSALWTQPVSVIDLLHYPLMRRLGGAGRHPRLVVLAFENLITDKMAILGARRFLHGTLVYGFCHMPLKPNVLSCYTDVHEREIAPLPDRVICNAPRYREILVREHYPEERVVAGAALRYAYLHEHSGPATPREPAVRRTVLVVLTMKKDATEELLDKVAHALTSCPDADVLVKPHPFARGHARRALEAIRGARIIDGSMRNALAAADVVVSSASGAALDTLFAGKPSIRVASDTQLDMDPLGWFEEFERPVVTSAEIAERLVHFLTPQTPQIPAACVVSTFFLPVSEDTMQVFLPGAA